MRVKLFAILLAVAPGIAQVTGNVLNRVFEIRVPGETGTAFFVEEADEQYLLTANHVVEQFASHATVELFTDGQWRPMDVIILHGDSQCDDVAVLIPTHKAEFVHAAPLPTTDKFAPGQEAYFLGFPFGLMTDARHVHMTFPMVKHGYISGVGHCSDFYSKASEDEGVFLLDAFNNPGFSGGPVVTRDLGDRSGAFKVIGIISAYRVETVPVSVNGQKTAGASVATNTGITIAIPFGRALELIRAYKDRRGVSAK